MCVVLYMCAIFIVLYMCAMYIVLYMCAIHRPFAKEPYKRDYILQKNI